MRRLLIAATVLLACTSIVAAQGWEWMSPLPQGNRLNDVDYLGDNRIFATGDYGSAIVSIDGGQTWSLRNDGSVPFPSEVDFVNSMEGWGIRGPYSPTFGAEFDNAVLHTSDGGITWENRYHNPHVTLEDISFTTPLNGWVVGTVDSTYDLIMLNTVDGGFNWSEQFCDSNCWTPAKVFFLNEIEGWVAAGHSTLHTIDGGISWESYPTAEWLYFDMTFVDNQHGWGAGFHDIFHTIDGGQTWIPENVPNEAHSWIRSVAVADADNIWAVAGGGQAIHSPDGGETWGYTLVDSMGNFEHIVFADALHGWICGARGAVYVTTDGGVTWAQRAGVPTIDEVYSLGALDFIDQQHGWMTGSVQGLGAPILHTENGGADWAVQFTDTASSIISGLKALTSTNIWAIGSRLLHSTDGGENWEVIDLIPNDGYLKMVCINEQVIWVITDWEAPLVHRTLDGGLTWDSHPVSNICKYSDMFASDANNVWVTSYSSLDDCPISHSSDGGVTWESQDSLDVYGPMFFLDPLHGWACSWPGLLRTNDGGATWNLAGPDSLWGYSIQFLDTLNGWVSGNQTYRTTDGGVTWDVFNPYIDSPAYVMDFVNPTYGWIISSPSMLRFDGSIFSTPDLPIRAPASFALLPAYPNPFNSTTTLRFNVPFAGRVRVEVFDIMGRQVQTLTDQNYTPGLHAIPFDADGLSSGLYFARATAGSLHSVQKLVLLK